MFTTVGENTHQILAQYDEHGNLVGGDHVWHNDHTHIHTWPGNTTAVPSADMASGITGNWTNMNLDHNHSLPDIRFNTSDIMIQNKNLVKVIEDMSILLKMIVEKYDLHEVRKLVEDTEVAIWAHDAKYREDLVEEKEEHLDEKLFEI